MYGEYVYPACRRLLEWKQRRYPNNPHRQPWEGPSGNQKGDKNDLPCKNIEETFQICSEPEEQENCTGFGRVLSWLEKINFSFPLWTLPEKPFIPPMQEGVRPPPLETYTQIHSRNIPITHLEQCNGARHPGRVHKHLSGCS